MAHIKFTEHPNLQRYHNNEYMPDDYVVDHISSEGVAQCTQEVADSLVAAFDHIDHYEDN